MEAVSPAVAGICDIAHRPRYDGVIIQNVAFSLSGAVDDYAIKV
jgi:hypothetical protein